MNTMRLVVREDRKWEQVVMAEVLVPGVVNNYGDIYTEEAIKQFAYEYSRQGYGLDVDHDNVDVTGDGYYVVESFLAREGDTEFIPGSWVVGIKVVDADLWARILAGELNGFSYEANVYMTPVEYVGTSGRTVSGVTSAHPVDGHTHDYLVVEDECGNPLEGGTSETLGHSHRIVSCTTTEVADGHNHRYQAIVFGIATDSEE